MKREKKHKRQWLKWGFLAVCIVGGVYLYRMVYARPVFDADRIAKAETRMWQAYYTDNKFDLGFQLIVLLRNQYGLSLFEAKEVGQLLARAALNFRSASGDYEAVALNDLVQAYLLIKEASGADFEPEQVARAELAWWVARRTPGQNSPQQVGEKIARLYTLLYGKSHPAFLPAGVLRAEAAALRDSGDANADWLRVEQLLQKSYRELAKAV